MKRQILLLLFLVTSLTLAQEEDGSKSKRQISALPTIENCKTLRQECLKSCDDVLGCNQKCPVCPIVTQVDPVPVNPSPSSSLINRKIVVEGANGTSHQYNYQYPGTTNHTTIIKLNNYINNTNHVNVPTHLNSTNVNNIHIYANHTEDGGSFGLGENEDGPCCFEVQPKNCRSGPDGVRCHHRRHRTCGQQCTSRVIYQHHSKQSYARSGCFYTGYWPFVNCGHRRDCSGCFDQYAYYYDCTGCYDQGFGYGQLYRRGPVMRPPMEPPCFVTGDCEYFEQSGEEFDHIFNDDDEQSLNATTADWGVILNNCKVISSNDTVTVENCTMAEKENPYAASPIDRIARSPPQFRAMPLPPPMPYYGGPPMEYLPPRSKRPGKVRKQKVGHKRRHRKIQE